MLLLLKSNDVDSAASLRRVDLAGKDKLKATPSRSSSEFKRLGPVCGTTGTRLVLETWFRPGSHGN